LRKRDINTLTGDEYRHLVKRLPCEICVEFHNVSPEPHSDESGSEAHHPRHGAGMARKSPDGVVTALCAEHHRGATGVHGLGSKAFVRIYGVTEAELSERTRVRVIELLSRRV